MSMKGITQVLQILVMASNLIITGISAECRRRPCYRIVCALGCTTPTRMGNMEPTGNCLTYPVGSRIVYRCVYNHDLTEISYCRTNGEWTKPTTACLKSWVIAPRTTTRQNEIKTEPETSRPLVTTDGTFSTPALSTADGEFTSLTSASDDLNLSKSQIPTTSTNSKPTTEEEAAVHQLQTSEFLAPEVNETKFGNETKETMEALRGEMTGPSAVNIVVPTVLGVIVLIILIVTLCVMKMSKNKIQLSRSTIFTPDPTDITTTL